MSILLKAIHDPVKALNRVYNSVLMLLPDELFLRVKFRQSMGKNLNLSNPRTYSEKLQWLKLYNHRPEYTIMADKYAVKEYVASKIGKEYIIPTLGIWDSVEEIEWGRLPDQFVLKCTHDSNGLVICRDKSTLDKQAAIRKLRTGLRRNYYRQNREWPYKNIKPRIIAEQYVEDEQTRELSDYKFFCFDGEVKSLFIATERMKEGEETKFDFFDDNFNHLPFTNGHPNAKTIPNKPICFEEMKRLARELSKGIPHVRVDLYEVNGRVYFGEMTFFHWSGFKRFDPEEWDYIFGSWIKLPNERVQ